ncbi:hypothetical protein CEUSTIGMA_g3375.t1 [Chlamydomonas eustigma]|uniref:Sugar phosphate transporter domain-containing protein n=1 Tax=Chlamydomonas eustigma TaxID=1157962 RepID=A0A250WZ89_9CHLO|nr:hypothetical protein CEUSTIGMA_g3375.t1 [Chlamydomonas eustigma]|eukprot:GAX75932.1 hypothetical protein CEUSTIGMA_g3375.t1 [Chlamydomonas eustigma]
MKTAVMGRTNVNSPISSSAVDKADVEAAGLLDTSDQKRDTHSTEILGVPAVLFAGICYCMASGSMVILNKHALASFNFQAPMSLLFFQCALAVVLVKFCELFGLVKLQPLKWDLVSVWFPVNLIFVGMIGSSFFALKEVGVGMVTVWKNLSNFVTAVGDVAIYKKSYTWGVWGVLFLMLGSAFVGASTDSKFSWSGYSWQVANCMFTSAYALYLRSVMDKVSEHTTNKQKMDEYSMVYYNNLLSLLPILGLIFAFNEHKIFLSQPALMDSTFLVVSLLGGIIGFAISFSSLWFLSQTTATIYSLVGALNKIPVAVLGIIAFNESTNPKNLASIVIGLGAGVLFVRVKQQK